MSAKLIAEEGLLEGLVLSFDVGDEWIVGRDPDECQMIVSDPAASEQQLRVLRTEEGGISVENLSDANPVQVNDETLTATPRTLQHGDALKIGSSRFRFYTEIEGTTSPLNGHKEEDGAEQDAAPSDAADQAVVAENKVEESVDQAVEESIGVDEDSFFHEESDDGKGLLAHVDFGLDDAGPFMLKVIRGPNNGAEFSMEPGRSYTLGTAANLCDVVFHDISVSRQHARLTIDAEQQMTIEDLGSRNGTLVNEVKITGKYPLAQNGVVALGTTTFIVFNRESERATIITPLLPSIVKTLQKDEVVKVKKKAPKPAPAAPVAPVAPPPPPPLVKKSNSLNRLLLLLSIGALVLGFGFATTTLFHSQMVSAPEVNTTAEIDRILAGFPGLQYSFNKDNGRLLLIGHVLTATGRSQLLYQLQSLPFIKVVDDNNLIVDEYLVRETNQILSKNPQWTGITLRATAPGQFVVTGYLKSRNQANLIKDFLSQNFRYLDLLDNRVVVEEDELNAIRVLVQERGFRDVSIDISNGEVALTGTMPADKAPALEKLVEDIKKRPTVRLVKDYVTQLEPEQNVIDISDTYYVSGSSNVGGVNLNVVINGRILTKGDLLDGMVIREIQNNVIFLERDGVKYKIEYNK